MEGSATGFGACSQDRPAGMIMGESELAVESCHHHQHSNATHHLSQTNRPPDVVYLSFVLVRRLPSSRVIGQIAVHIYTVTNVIKSCLDVTE